MDMKYLTLVQNNPLNPSATPPENAAASALSSTAGRHEKGGARTRLWRTHTCMVGSCLAVVVLTLCGLAAPASAGDQVPFSASGTGVVTGTTHLPGGLTQVDQSFSGNATHLGNFTGTGTGLLDHQGNFTQTSCLVGATGTDSVCIAFGGDLERTKGSCVATTTGLYTVTGGTGSFARASGEGTFTAQFDECAGITSATLTGTISRPNSG